MKTNVIKHRALTWLTKHAKVTRGYYLRTKDHALHPERTYCMQHGRQMSIRLIKRYGLDVSYCTTGGGADTTFWCAISTCRVALDFGGLTDYGIRTTLGLEEENPLKFLADVDELLLVSQSLFQNDDLWDLWLSQVFRRYRKPTTNEQLAFEAAWLAGNRRLALDILTRARK